MKMVYQVSYTYKTQMTHKEFRVFLRDQDVNTYLVHDGIVLGSRYNGCRVLAYTVPTDVSEEFLTNYFTMIGACEDKQSDLSVKVCAVDKEEDSSHTEDSIEATMVLVKKIFPNASWDTSNKGELIILTDCRVVTETLVLPL